MARSDWKRPSEFPIDQGKRRIRLDISYDGANFFGWQRQKSGRTVQEEIEQALYRIIAEQVRVQGSGRTDAKVHAIGQVAHFDCSNQRVPAAAFAVALNQLLPRDVRIFASSEVSDRFHARFTSICREYRYYSKELSSLTPFERNRVCRIRKFPPLELLNGYAEAITGTHDFTTFCAAADQSESKVRDIYHSSFHIEPSQWKGNLLVYTVSGNAFLMHQVRSMVGTMLQLGEQEVPPEEFIRRLESRQRMEAGRTAPAEGLYLYRIDYDPY
jgi:tRNA pseudouridine38-40 synthase